jgi:hypothetical protein
VEGEAAATNGPPRCNRAPISIATGEGRPGEPAFRAYNALNRLAIEALLLPAGAAPQAAIELARHCRLAAAEAYRRSASVWDAVMVPEALLIERLLDGGLMQTGDTGEQASAEVARAYHDTLANLTVKPREFDSVVAQILPAVALLRCPAGGHRRSWLATGGRSADRSRGERLARRLPA